MARTGRPPEHMPRMRARRRPFTAPRAGRLLNAIQVAFLLSRGEVISTSRLVKSCYPVAHIFGGLKSWHRSNVARAARRVAVRIFAFPVVCFYRMRSYKQWLYLRSFASNNSGSD